MKPQFSGVFVLNPQVAKRMGVGYAKQVRSVVEETDIKKQIKDGLPDNVKLSYNAYHDSSDYITVERADENLGYVYRGRAVMKGFPKKKEVKPAEALETFVRRAVEEAQDLVAVNEPI